MEPGWTARKLLAAEVDVAVGEDVRGSQAADHLDSVVAESVQVVPGWIVSSLCIRMDYDMENVCFLPCATMTVHEEEYIRRSAIDVVCEEIVAVDEESQVYHGFMALIPRRMKGRLTVIHDVGIELNTRKIGVHPVEVQSFFLGRRCYQCHARWIRGRVVDSIVS